MRHCIWIFALLLLSMGSLSAEDFGYELQDGKLTILMYGGYADWKKNASENDKRAVTEIYIEEGVPVIPSLIFKDLPRVGSVTIPASVTMIGGAAFAGCSNLSSVVFAKDSELRTLGKYAFYETALESVVIPASVTAIRKAAFRYCYNLSSVIFAGNQKLKEIGEWAFCETSLESVVIPASVTTIGKAAFTECKRLSSVTFTGDMNLRTIGEGAFAKTPLESVMVPSSVTAIGGAAFTDCRKLSSVTFAEKSELEKIGAGGFYGTALSSVELPFSVKTIGAGSFSHSALKSVVIPASVTDIERAAFSQTYLTSVIIPSSVKAIGKEVFQCCSELTDVTFLSSKAPARFGENVFENCFSLEAIYVPEGSSGYSGENWVKYEDLIKRKIMFVSSGSLTALYNLFSFGEMGGWSIFNPLIFGLFAIICVLKKIFLG
ncbi:leucine-rich repeat domain-containing protein [Parabacteroides goldsteinii]|uniref:leucine-rich repeat domain-containing protein n=1 Tax=Parabacteroides goldsteinii TaxID=328812 RepID=UPI0032B2D3FA